MTEQEQGRWFIPQLREIADRYQEARDTDQLAESAWLALRDECLEQAAGVETELGIVIAVSDESEPYPDAPAMLADLDRGRFIVSRANSEHPIWTVEENVAFRISNDVFGHYLARSDFSWEGENAACAEHAPRLSPLARRALFTECIAQTAVAIADGDFPAQKTVLLDQAFDLDCWG